MSGGSVDASQVSEGSWPRWAAGKFVDPRLSIARTYIYACALGIDRAESAAKRRKACDSLERIRPENFDPSFHRGRVNRRRSALRFPTRTSRVSPSTFARLVEAIVRAASHKRPNVWSQERARSLSREVLRVVSP